MLYDNEFLKQLDQQTIRTIHVRITSLTLDERPLETIEGRTTQGSVNIDGSSAVRRTCNLSFISDTTDFTDYYWSYNTKFKLEIGLENYIDPRYDDIIWFKQGTYIITSFSSSLNTNSFNINISGKDKMCRLNGENGGTINSSVDFGTIQDTDANGITTITKLPIKNIIKEMVHTYGDEPFHNIIINDLDELGLELMEYKYDSPMYIWRKATDSSDYENGTLYPETIKCSWNGKEGTLKEAAEDENVKFEQLNPLPGAENPTTFTINGNDYYVAEITYGETAGYRETPLTYAGDLIANPGETVTSVLDKIKKMLGNFEYFYNVDGQFIFQKQKTYVDTAWTPLITTEEGANYIDYKSSPIAYSFSGLGLITAFNNTPNIANLKNDYTVWGEHTGDGGNKVSVHMRYAIDEKPISYTTIAVTDSELTEYNEQNGFQLKGQPSISYISSTSYEFIPKIYNNTILFFNNNIKWMIQYESENNSLKIDDNKNYVQYNEGQLKIQTSPIYCDWREVIYHMALDYRKYNHLDDFEQRVAKANPDLYPTGKTGYEQYYIDLEGFWRQLYNPNPYTRAYNITSENFVQENTEEKGYLYIKIDQDFYIKANNFVENTIYYRIDTSFYGRGEERYPWNKSVYEEPEKLNFWLDFLDTNAELGKYSCKAIGSRPKVEKNNEVKAIYYKETPQIIFVNSTENNSEEGRKTGYKYFNVGGYASAFSQSTQGQSAKDSIDTLLYNHAVTTESVSITAIPVYYLEPNVRIYINDENTKINGEYIATKYSLPLTYNGTMSITATKAVDRLL